MKPKIFKLRSTDSKSRESGEARSGQEQPGAVKSSRTTQTRKRVAVARENAQATRQDAGWDDEEKTSAAVARQRRESKEGGKDGGESEPRVCGSVRSSWTAAWRSIPRPTLPAAPSFPAAPSSPAAFSLPANPQQPPADLSHRLLRPALCQPLNILLTRSFNRQSSHKPRQPLSRNSRHSSHTTSSGSLWISCIARQSASFPPVIVSPDTSLASSTQSFPASQHYILAFPAHPCTEGPH